MGSFKQNQQPLFINQNARSFSNLHNTKIHPIKHREYKTNKVETQISSRFSHHSETRSQPESTKKDASKSVRKPVRTLRKATQALIFTNSIHESGNRLHEVSKNTSLSNLQEHTTVDSVNTLRG